MNDSSGRGETLGLSLHRSTVQPGCPLPAGERVRARVLGWLGGLAAFAVPMLVYLLTLAPTITWAHDGGDGGDLITAAYTLGVPHPPGYPIYCLLGRLFACLPLGDVARRLNLMSAVGAGLAALGLYLAVLERRRGAAGPGAAVAGLGAAWAVALVPVLWSQALIAEVYALNAAFVSLVLLLALRVHRFASAPAVLGLAWGLGLGTHVTGVALLPVVAWSLGISSRPSPVPPGGGLRPCSGQAPALEERGWRRRQIGRPLGALFGACLGLCVYAYLPLRAGRGAVTWGDPSTLSGWWWVVSGALYRGYVFALPWAAVPGRLLTVMRYLVWGFGPTGVALGLVGLDVLGRRQRGLSLATATGLSWLLYVVYAVGYDTSDSTSYLIPAMLIFALWVGQGLVDGLRWLRRRLGPRLGLAVGVCLACAGPLSALILNYPTMDVHRDTSARTFGEEVLAAAPEHAVLLTAQDAHTFTLWYFQRVEGRRPDVAVVDVGLLGYDWYHADLGRSYPGLMVSRRWPACDPDQLGQANPGRPICEVGGKENHWLRCTGDR